MKRIATITRTTLETDIACTLNLDGKGQANVVTGIGMFDHLLTAFARHGAFDLELSVQGDLDVDGHHSVEDAGIVLGQAFESALGGKGGIRRFGDCALPMDEALILAACDFSGRGGLFWQMDVPLQMVGQLDSSLAKEFFIAFAAHAGLTLHVVQLAGENTHHILEALFKAVARAVREAIEIDERMQGTLPSTKGVL